MEEKEPCHCAFRLHIKVPLIKEEYRGLLIDILQLPPDILLEFLTENQASFEEFLAEISIQEMINDK
jgi:hypothetical protein